MAHAPPNTLHVPAHVARHAQLPTHHHAVAQLHTPHTRPHAPCAGITMRISPCKCHHAGASACVLGGHPEEVYHVEWVDLGLGAATQSLSQTLGGQLGDADGLAVPAGGMPGLGTFLGPGDVGGLTHANGLSVGSQATAVTAASNPHFTTQPAANGVQQQHHSELGSSDWGSGSGSVSRSRQGPQAGLTSSQLVTGATTTAAGMSSSEAHLLAASAESLFLWDVEAGVLLQQADAPGTSGSTVPAGARVCRVDFHATSLHYFWVGAPCD